MAEKRNDDDIDDIRSLRRERIAAEAFEPRGERVETVAHLITNEGPAENADAALHLAGTYIDNPDAVVDNSITRPALADTEYSHGGKVASLPSAHDALVSEHSDTGRPDFIDDHDQLHDLAEAEATDDDPPFDVGPAPDNRIDFHPVDIDRGADLVGDGGPVPHDQSDLGDFDA